MDGEEWRPVVGWEGIYSVSSLGNVRREVSRRVFSPCVRPVKPAGNGTGYLKVHLRKNPREGSQHLIHRLVLAAFVGPCPPGHEANHKDGNKHNNRVENLEWVTPKENQRHRFAVLGHPKSPGPEPRFGIRHPAAKFTDEIIREMRRLYAAGWKQREIAEKFNTGQTVVSGIVRRIRWPHVT